MWASSNWMKLGWTVPLSHRHGVLQLRRMPSVQKAQLCDDAGMVLCIKQRKRGCLLGTRPGFIQNRPGQIPSFHVSVYSNGWLLHNKKQPVLHGNSLVWSRIKQHWWVICFWLIHKPILLFPHRGLFWHRTVEHSASWLGYQNKAQQNTLIHHSFPWQLLGVFEKLLWFETVYPLCSLSGKWCVLK